MRIDSRFTIDAPAERVWSALLDLERVAPCMPGAQIDPRGDDSEDTYHGRFRIKVGPVSAAYRGRIEIANRDEVGRIVVLRGSGSDAGGGTATATIASEVVEVEGGSEVRMTTDLDVTGRLAQFGGRSSLSQSVADRIVGQFAERLRQQLAGDAEEIDGTAMRAPAGGSAAGDAPAPGAVRAAGPSPGPPGGEQLDALAFARGMVVEGLQRPRAAVALAALGALAVGIALGAVVRRGVDRARVRLPCTINPVNGHCIR